MGNGSTWPENDYRGMKAHTRTHTHQLSQMKQLTSTHAHTMNWKYHYLQTNLLIQPQKRQDRDDTVFMFFLPKVKCLITSKQMASTHPKSAAAWKTHRYMCPHVTHKEWRTFAKFSTCFTGLQCICYDTVNIRGLSVESNIWSQLDSTHKHTHFVLQVFFYFEQCSNGD